MNKYYMETRRKGIPYIQRRKAKWIDYILRRNCLLKDIIGGNIGGRKDEE
jgi:hypothetical protein